MTLTPEEREAYETGRKMPDTPLDSFGGITTWPFDEVILVQQLCDTIDRLLASPPPEQREAERIERRKADDAYRCDFICPHGDRCTRDKGHECGCYHRLCDCNEASLRITTRLRETSPLHRTGTRLASPPPEEGSVLI